MLLGKRAMSHSNLLYHFNAEWLPLRHILAEGHTTGRAVGLETKWDTSKFGCLNIPMPRWAELTVIFTNIASLCRNISIDLLKVMSLFITRMALRMIIVLTTLSCLFKKFTEGELSVLTVGRSLQ